MNLIFKLAWMKSHRGKLRRTRILGVGDEGMVTKKTSRHKAEASSASTAEPQSYKVKRESKSTVFSVGIRSSVVRKI